ncbi:hypothetical protein CCMSSC00406_0008666 [Pleurotus cornucopiae]|nr:hypothetical protein CCMSSC00406_0008666 [Pleurotus cornucopiae]
MLAADYKLFANERVYGYYSRSRNYGVGDPQYVPPETLRAPHTPPSLPLSEATDVACTNPGFNPPLPLLVEEKSMGDIVALRTWKLKMQAVAVCASSKQENVSGYQRRETSSGASSRDDVIMSGSNFVVMGCFNSFAMYLPTGLGSTLPRPSPLSPCRPQIIIAT